MRHVTALLVLFLVSCAGSQPGQPDPEPRDLLRTALKVARTVGDAVLRVDGYAALQKYAKEAIPLIDANGDKQITIQEVEDAAQTLVNEPELAAGLLAAAYFLVKR